jgi:fatty acid amide hydrolase 2
LKDADDADKFIASGVMSTEEIAEKKPFLGVPISTKDCIAVKDLLFTGGLYHRKNTRADKDAVVMAKMREAGAIPFALTNVSELCMWYESNNTIHGRTNNPYDSNRIVGGSSGGEGTIQAAAASPFGIGSDIGGSIRMPAFFNGVFGHKPSQFCVSNDGQFPDTCTDEQRCMLSTGPMCRYASDLLPMMKLIAEEEYLPKLRLDEPVDVRKLKIYYQENDGGAFLVSKVDKDLQEAFRKVVNHFKTLKVDIEPVQIQRTRKTGDMWLANMSTRGSTSFSEQMSLDPSNPEKPIIELCKWFFGKSCHTFIGIVTAIVEDLGVKADTPRHDYLLSERDKTIAEFGELLKDDNAVFLYPTHPCVAPYHNEPIVRAFNFTYTSIINLIGFPSCSIPLGLGSEGLPLGLQCVANLNNDRLCLAVAVELEKAFGGWVAFA